MNPRYALLAACMMHVEGYYSVNSLAFRNHNPGNIEHGNGTMQIYPTALNGFQALLADIAANAGKPLNVFIAKYAPPNENNTSLYLQIVSTLSDIAPEELL
jgi:hypothetical protein